MWFKPNNENFDFIKIWRKYLKISQKFGEKNKI